MAAGTLDTKGGVVAGNGIAGNTYILSVDDVSGTSTAAAITEATTGDANDNVYTVVGVEGITDGDHIALQGTAAPSLTGCTLVATFTQNPA